MTLIMNDFIAESIVLGIDSNENDLALHKLNLERYENILLDPDLEEGEFKEKIRKEIPILKSRINEVEVILKHTYSQITEQQIEDTRIKIEAKQADLPK